MRVLSPRPSHRRPSRTSRLFTLLCALALCAFGQRAAIAQDATHDLLRGQVRGADSAGVRNATVSVTPSTAAAGAPPFVVRTDSTGHWSMTVTGTAPTYAVSITALGYAPQKVTARRTGETAIVVNVTLSRAVVNLGPVRVSESRRAPPPREGIGTPQEQTSSERGVDNAPGAIAAADQGNLAAMAASVPGVSLIPDANGGPPGFSVLGLSPDQNSVTLNGMQFSGGDIPRDAIAFTRVAATSYDVSRGGFSGGQLAIGAFSGGNFHQRNAHVTFDSPTLQFTDPVGRQLGNQYTNGQLSGSLFGPIVFDKVFYNMSFQVGRRSSDVQSLLANDVGSWERIGVAPDSVQRLITSLSRAGVPLTGAISPSDKQRTNASALARIDWNKSQDMTSNMVVSVRRNTSSALFLGATAVPGHGGDETSSGADITGNMSAYIHKNILSDLRVGAHVNRTSDDPYLKLPDARVLVSSQLNDGSTGITSLAFGGNAFLPRAVDNSGGEIFEQVSWLSEDGKHRTRVTANLRDDAFSQDQYANRRGSYFYNSIADIDANRPASFNRTFVSHNVSSSALNSAFSLGDNWRPTARTQFLYGVRVEGVRFGDKPDFNPDVESAFHVRTDNTPSEYHVSPRVGFFWGIGDRGTKGLRGAPKVQFRGGVGEFRNSTAATLIAPAMRATGLPDAVRQIQCIGSAVPIPDWNAFANNESTIPTQCLGGVSSFSSTQPNVYLIGPGYAAQRSWRTNFAITGPTPSKWVIFQAEGVYSVNLHQQAPLDLNFTPTQRFTLGAEGSRPVYAAPTSIVPGSGAVTNRDSRLFSQFGSVTELTSNLRSESKQLILTLSPLQFVPGFTWNLNYVHQWLREQGRGFGGTTAGNPLDVEWARSSMDARHQVNASITMRVHDLFSFAVWSRFSSGSPFTPLVSGDINGDGQSNDRAFIFNPATADSAVRAGMTSLLAGASPRIRNCLERQLNQIAQRNSCEGPWTATTNAVATLNPEKLGMQNRVTLSLSLTNFPAGLDAMLHGSSKLQGWGQSGFSDPSLLTVRGFDPTTNRYKYEVNSRFGDTRLSRTGTRNPFLVTLEARMQLGHIFVEQAVDQAMAPGRTRGKDKLSPSQIKQRAMNSVFNPVGQLLAVKDSFTFITKDQLAALATLQRRIGAQQDSIWNPVADWLAAQPAEFDRKAVLDRVYDAQLKMFDVVVAGIRDVKQILSAEQIRELPPFMLIAFDEKALMQTRPTMAFFPNF